MLKISDAREFEILKIFYDVTKVVGLNLVITSRLYEFTVADERDKAQACGHIAILNDKLGNTHKIFIKKHENN